MLMRETWGVIHDQCQDYDTSSFPITIGHDVNCYDHATGARTMWGNRVIETERKAERERKRERMAEREHKDPPVSILDVGSNRSGPRTDERKRHEAVVAGVHGCCDRGQINPWSGGGAWVEGVRW